MRISDWSSDVCSSDLNAFIIDPALKPPAPKQPGLHVYVDWDLNDLREHIDWTPFFRAWELAGVYPAILDDAIVGESARSLFADAQKMLDRMIAEKRSEEHTSELQSQMIITYAVLRLQNNTTATTL